MFEISQGGSNHRGRRSGGANSLDLWELKVLGWFAALPLAMVICQQSRALVHVRSDTMGSCSHSLQLCKLSLRSFHIIQMAQLTSSSCKHAQACED